jgi:hypothetical protein
MSAPAGMERLFGEWEAFGEMDLDGQTIKVTGHATIQPLGEFVVLRSTVQPPEFPDSVSIIGGAPEGEPAPMHYFDERGVQRVYLSKVADDRWTIWRGDDSWRESPGHNQRYVGEISPDGSRITGAWWRGLGDAGDQWEVDFTLNYERLRR